MSNPKKPEFTVSGTVFVAVALIGMGVAVGVVAIVLWRGLGLLTETVQGANVNPVRARGLAFSVLWPVAATLASAALVGSGVFAFWFGLKERRAERKRLSRVDNSWSDMPFPKG